MFSSVEMLVNHACDPGPYLDPVKVSQLPHIFRGRVRDVLQDGIQAIVIAAFNPKTVLGFLQPGRGKVRTQPVNNLIQRIHDSLFHSFTALAIEIFLKKKSSFTFLFRSIIL